MAGNNAPIFTKVGDIQGGVYMAAAPIATDYAGTNTTATNIIFIADSTNGGYVQRLRFKAAGSNNATVARVFINDGSNNQVTTITSSTWTTPPGTPSSSGGSLLTQSYYAKVQSVDQYGSLSPISTETAAVSVTGPTGLITWNWTAATGAASYNLFVGGNPGGEYARFTTTTNFYTQTQAIVSGQVVQPQESINNNMFYGEVSLPQTVLSTTAATVDVDYPMNLALPPGYRIMVSLGNPVAGGWYCTAIGGKY